MNDTFDAYYKWLAIPKGDRPIHFYRLLGIPLYEDDIDVISVAADRQMSHIKTFASGKYAGTSQQILNELSQAKICLTNFESKLHYDTELKKLLRPATKGNHPQGDKASENLFAELGMLGADVLLDPNPSPRAPVKSPIRVPQQVPREEELPTGKLFLFLLLFLLGLFLVVIIAQRILATGA